MSAGLHRAAVAGSDWLVGSLAARDCPASLQDLKTTGATSTCRAVAARLLPLAASSATACCLNSGVNWRRIILVFMDHLQAAKSKASLKVRRKRAAWSTDFLKQILATQHA
jgi:hypothetical protein